MGNVLLLDVTDKIIRDLRIGVFGYSLLGIKYLFHSVLSQQTCVTVQRYLCLSGDHNPKSVTVSGQVGYMKGHDGHTS